ncbi:MAG: adenylate/guanylate cyclase domain-containing protein [Bacteroidota bacterium]
MSIEQSAPVSPTEHHPSVLLAILFADVSGSTKLYETLGNTRAQAIIGKALEVLSEAARRHEGTIVKNIGDELMCTFPDPLRAAAAAQDMQRSLKQAIAMGTIPYESLSIRTGFHHGQVIAKSGDVFGDAVNVAARVVAQAKKGQILTTKQTVDELPEQMKESLRFIDRAAVKGKKEELELFEVIWEFENLTVVQNVFESKPHEARLSARFGQITIELSRERTTLQMGRGMENDFVIPEPLASRTHARIEFRRDRFVLIDQSINGTFVQMDGEREVALRRDELVLRGTGAICLGKSTALQPEMCVQFRIETPTG